MSRIKPLYQRHRFPPEVIQYGEDGLESMSRRPHYLPNTKVGKEEEQLFSNYAKHVI